MSITVRTERGELTFANMSAIFEALRAGELSLKDEVQSSSKAADWIRLEACKPPRSFGLPRLNGWYVVTGLLVLEVLLGLRWPFLIATVAAYVGLLRFKGKRVPRGLGWMRRFDPGDRDRSSPG